MALLLLDGEELAGSKQDRILNTTILAAPHSATIIPVSCVEQGRWHYRSRTFHTEERMYKPADRSKKEKRVFESIKAGSGFNAGQSDVWEEVASLHRKFGVRSATYAMADIYDHHRGNLDAFISGFAISDGQTGFVALINGRITGLEALSRPDAFRHTWPKLIKSYAIATWLSSINQHDFSIHKSLGLGNDLRWDEVGTVGFILDYQDEAIHTAVFGVGKEK